MGSDLVGYKQDNPRMIRRRTSESFTNVPFRDKLDLTSHYDAPGGSTEETLRHRLVTVIDHAGWDLDEWHFVTFAQNPSGQWVEINDENITAVDFEEVARGNRKCYEPPYLHTFLFYSTLRVTTSELRFRPHKPFHYPKKKPGEMEGPNKTVPGDAEQPDSSFHEIDKSPPSLRNEPVNQPHHESPSVSTKRISEFIQAPNNVFQIATSDMKLEGTFQSRVKRSYKCHALP
ncbi:hypothetical protein ACJ72_04689 [Emergomyces africanus]|uniref:USP domain-containing protein n=1 Tax=Emergomyces africanus TaxID=1955775 RepID=A0A1B7NW32_9EURO|nr:hypothetical protein ACJ72_04689 [Emergomyces africanus]